MTPPPPPLASLTAHPTGAAAPAAHPGPEDQACDQAEARWLGAQADLLRPLDLHVLLACARGDSTAQTARDFATTPKAIELVIRKSRAALHALAAAARFERPERPTNADDRPSGPTAPAPCRSSRCTPPRH